MSNFNGASSVGVSGAQQSIAVGAAMRRSSNLVKPAAKRGSKTTISMALESNMEESKQRNVRKHVP